MIPRREFITLLGGAAAWPLAARAQQGERMRRIGALMNVTSDDPESSLRVAAFSQGLQELGWSVGRNVRIDWRWAGADRERARTYAAEWVALAPEVVLTAGLGVRPMLQATRTVPIVFAGLNDPVGAGVVRSLARPGGNITGLLWLNMGSAQNGSNCSSRLNRALRAWRSFAIPSEQADPATWERFRGWHHLCGWS